jgi:TldD protein
MWLNRRFTESSILAVGVRALANGAWGFVAHSKWTPDLVAQMGRKAAEHARAISWPNVPPIELVDRPPAAVGNWVTPIKRDPFMVPPEEVNAWVQSVEAKGPMVVALTFERQERTFASTEGAYTTQTIYTSLGGVPHEDVPPSMIRIGRYELPFMTPTGAGYEVLEDAKVLEHIPEWKEKAKAVANARSLDTLGEYDIVFDGAAMAAIVNGTFGASLEYDRVIGYEANAGGTSYLQPPLKVLGTSYAPAAVTITGDRTLSRGAATVGWDDEGIAPTPFPLVKDGVVVDYASSREFVSELAPWYQRHGVPVRSNGCSASESASTVPLVYTPNLVLHPDAQDTSLDALVAGIEDGLLVCGGKVRMDFQQMTGRGLGVEVYTIKHGKQAGPVKDAMYWVHSQSLWKNLVALGGVSTAALRGLPASKGQPTQETVHSVQAVAARFRKIQVNNKNRA